MTTILVAMLTAIITSAVMVYLFAPKQTEDDSIFDEIWDEYQILTGKVSSTGAINYASSINCAQCDFEAKTPAGLKTHITSKHSV